MATKRLIPYSVHLPEDVYLFLKEAGKSRQASAMVRDAIQMLMDDSSTFEAGYKKGVKDCIGVIKKDPVLKHIVSIKTLEAQLKSLTGGK